MAKAREARVEAAPPTAVSSLRRFAGCSVSAGLLEGTPDPAAPAPEEDAAAAPAAEPSGRLAGEGRRGPSCSGFTPGAPGGGRPAESSGSRTMEGRSSGMAGAGPSRSRSLRRSRRACRSAAPRPQGAAIAQPGKGGRVALPRLSLGRRDRARDRTARPNPSQPTQAAVGRPLSLLPRRDHPEGRADERGYQNPGRSRGKAGGRTPPPPTAPPMLPQTFGITCCLSFPVASSRRAAPTKEGPQTRTHTHPRGPRREAGLKLVPLSFRPDPGPCFRPPRVTVWGPPRPPDTPLDTVASSALEASQDPRPTRARFKHDPNTISSRPETYPRGSSHQHAMLRNACSHRPCASQRPPSGPDT